MTSPGTSRLTLLPFLAGLALATAACDGDLDADPGLPDAGETPDASRPGLRFLMGDREITSLDFGEAVVDADGWRQSVVVVNTAATATAALRVTVDGAGAAAYSPADVASTCDGGALAPGGRCAIRVRFQPGRIGALGAALRVETDGAAATLALTGTGRASSLVFDHPVVDLGLIQRRTPVTLTETVTNQGTTNVAGLTTTLTGAGFTLLSSTCAGALRPHASCTLMVKVEPDAIGAMSGAIHLAAEHERSDAALLAVSAHRITAFLGGAGSSRIVSTPPGIDCAVLANPDDGCSALFAVPVEMQVVLEEGAAIDGWSSVPCDLQGVNPCRVPLENQAPQIRVEVALK